jgi:hypothetical protein
MTTGQGKPLPPSMKCQGEWIVEGHLYLYYSDHDQSQSVSTPMLTVGVGRVDGGFAFGVDAAHLAAALKTDRDTVIAANRDGTLKFLGIADVPPSRSGISATRYVFQLGEQKGSFTIEKGNPEGTA